MPRSVDAPLTTSAEERAPAPPARRRRRRRAALPVALLAVVVLLAFFPVLRGGFVNWDDTDMIVRNVDLNPPALSTVLRYWRGPHMGLYIPLTYTTYAGLAAVSRVTGGGPGATPLDPWVFHACALLLHLASATFAWLILRRLGVPRWAAWTGAAIFAAHPIQAEAVAWAASLNTVLSGALLTAALWCYVEHATTAPRRAATRWFIVATVLFLLALLAKPSAVVAPLLAAAMEALMLRRPARAWWIGIAAWLVVAGTFALIARGAQPAATLPALPLAKRPIVAADAVAFYLEKVAFPRAFAIDYGRTPQAVLASAGSPAAAVLVTAALLAAAWTWRRREPAITAGITLFVLALLPVLGLVPFEFQQYSTVADRYAYPAMLGVALVAARLAARWHAARVALTVGVGVLMVLSMRQAARWHDTYALAHHALAVNPRSVAAHKVLAATHAADKQPAEAGQHYRAALALRPDDPEVLFNYGNLLLRQRAYVEAAETLRAARQQRPRDVRVMQNLAVALAMTGERAEAERLLVDAIDLAPDDPELRQNLQLVRGTSASRPAPSGASSAATTPPPQPPSTTTAVTPPPQPPTMPTPPTAAMTPTRPKAATSLPPTLPTTATSTSQP